MTRPARIVLFLGDFGDAERVRYTLVGHPEPPVEEEGYLPWSVLIPSARGDDADGVVQLLVVGSQQTLEQWVESHRLHDDLYEADYRDRDVVPIGFLRYDERTFSAGNPDAFWSFFDDLRKVLEGGPVVGLDSFVPVVGSPADTFAHPADRVIVDITRGFRAAPFIGAAALGFVRASTRRRPGAGEARALTHRIYYAAFAAKDAANVTPLWDLTPFVDAVELSDALDAFSRHGRADDLAGFLAGARTPAARALAEPMQAFADDLLWMRIPNLLSHSAPGLHAALEESLSDLRRAFPPVAEDLDALDAEVRGLVPDGRPVQTVSLDGLSTSMILGQRLYRTGRYAEVYNLLRETLLSAVTLTILADTAQQPCDRKRFPRFKAQRRDIVERRWNSWHAQLKAGRTPTLEGTNASFVDRIPDVAKDVLARLDDVANRRNDVAHCSMNQDCRQVDDLLESVAESLEETAALIRSLREQEPGG